MTLAERVSELERRIDSDYIGCFPVEFGRETACLYLQLIYDSYARQNLRHIDDLKYPLMHATRWGARARSYPVPSMPVETDQTCFEKCQAAFWRANEYVGLCGAFISYHRGIVTVSELDQDTIAFSPNGDWAVYEVLDSKLHEEVHVSDDVLHLAQRIGRHAQRAIEDGACGLTTPDLSVLRELSQSVVDIETIDDVLPPTWAFDGISITTLRHFWRTLFVIGSYQYALTSRLQLEAPSFVQLLGWTRCQWIDCIHECSKLDRQQISRLLDSLTLEFQSRSSDIAITPLLPINDRLLATSPWLLATGNSERNYCANLAKQGLFDTTSAELADVMAADLKALYEAAGFQVALSVPISTSLGETDIDLLVWSRDERFAMSAELKWMIKVADFMEVLNRGEARTREALERQLPKHEAALSAGVGVLLQRAFNLKDTPTVDGWASGAILRGHVGSPVTRNARFFVVPEELLHQCMQTAVGLREIAEWAREMPFLPVENRDFVLRQIEVVTPSGIEVSFFDHELT